MSYQWCDFLVAVVGFVELPYAEQVRPGETSQPRLSLGDEPCQLLHGAITSFRRFDLAADRRANLPVEIDQGRIHYLERLLTRGRDHLNDVRKGRFVC